MGITWKIYLALTIASAMSLTAAGKSSKKPFKMDCEEWIKTIRNKTIDKFGKRRIQMQQSHTNSLC